MEKPYRGAALRVDAAVHPSRVPVVIFALLGMLWTLALLADLLWWHYALLLAVCALTGYLTQTRWQVIHLSQPPLSQGLHTGWQLLIAQSPRPALWQAQLLGARHYGWAVHLDFMVQEPYPRRLSFLLYADQFSDTDWYALGILARSISAHTNG
ncbi:hypothetical protein [Psychrobacter aestuarii]|uniref:DUF58 domain-containing protein n=1 Tax=Psychrobacter aestuarii TaxID=556327 RepID=A0ABN0VV48_9GAMM|nr:hypothetical protein [Psychrobacter aestuarii]